MHASRDEKKLKLDETSRDTDEVKISLLRTSILTNVRDAQALITQSTA